MNSNSVCVDFVAALERELNGSRAVQCQERRRLCQSYPLSRDDVVQGRSLAISPSRAASFRVTGNRRIWEGWCRRLLCSIATFTPISHYLLAAMAAEVTAKLSAAEEEEARMKEALDSKEADLERNNLIGTVTVPLELKYLLR